jgi:hypothetical protein
MNWNAPQMRPATAEMQIETLYRESNSHFSATTAIGENFESTSSNQNQKLLFTSRPMLNLI